MHEKTQAVKHQQLGLIQVVFHQPGKVNLTDAVVLTAEHPALVMIKLDKNDAVERITVADPSRQLNAMKLTINTPSQITGDDFKYTRDELTK